MAERPTEMDEFLCDQGRMVRVCTVRPNGTAHVVPLCYKFYPEDSLFFLSTGADSVTVKNLKKNPALTLCIDDAEPPFRCVTVEGDAEVSEELGTDHEGMKRIIDQFFGPEMWETYKETPTAQKIRVRITLKPKKWVWWDWRRQLQGSVKVG